MTTAFGNVPVGARYHCAECDAQCEVDAEPKNPPTCGYCGYEMTYNGALLPEPIATEGWNSSAIGRYWQAQRQPTYNTQLDFFDL